MIHYTNCPNCGSTEITPIFDVKDHTVSGKLFTILRCGQCSLRFTQDIPNKEEIGQYYQSDSYVSHTDTRKGLINQIYHEVRKHTLKGKRKMIEGAMEGRTGQILDYGCGTGAFLDVMKKRGWEVTGIEPDSGARSIAEAQYQILPMDPSSIALLKDHYFDIITLWHVLEHVHDLHNTLAHLRRMLKKDGKIFIAVPNHSSQDAAHYGPAWAAWDVPRHLYHFSPDSMKYLLEKAGFRQVNIRPMWFDSYYVSMLSEQYKNGRPNLLSAVWRGFQSNLAAGKDLKRCSSLIYIAEPEGAGH
jgi:2-polyprenyl-3-methyl-5-hydroxy-6-metoxy-1,4-benzoquinol methylase